MTVTRVFTDVYCFKDVSNYTRATALQREIYRPAYATDLPIDKRGKNKNFFFSEIQS